MFLISLLQKHLGEIQQADLQVYCLLRRDLVGPLQEPKLNSPCLLLMASVHFNSAMED